MAIKFNLTESVNTVLGQQESSTWPVSSRWQNQNKRNLKVEFNMTTGFNLTKQKFYNTRTTRKYNMTIEFNMTKQE